MKEICALDILNNDGEYSCYICDLIFDSFITNEGWKRHLLEIHYINAFDISTERFNRCKFVHLFQKQRVLH